MGAHVINMSWGIDLAGAGPADLEAIQVIADAIDFAASRGVIMVAAAGNSGTASLHFPANNEEHDRGGQLRLARSTLGVLMLRRSGRGSR
jgi:subtilisin family serine protease